MQKKRFSDIYSVLEGKTDEQRELPHLMRKLNIYKDDFGMLRVLAKINQSGRKLSDHILLPNNHQLTESIITKVRKGSKNSGIYATLNKLRKYFWIEKYFSTVKKVLNNDPLD